MFNNKISRFKLISLIIIMQVIVIVICYYCLNIMENFKYSIILFCSILIVVTIILFIAYNLKRNEIKKLENIISEHENTINKLIVYKKSEEEQFELLSDVSHELRTPLTSIIGFAKIINRRLNKVIIPFITNENNNEQSDKSEISKAVLGINKISENIEIIISESERLTSLINNLLDFSKLRSDKIDWKVEKTDLREVISKGILISYSLLDNKDLELNDEIDENIPFVYVDKNKILQVIINLLSNAIKFTERGKIICRAKMYNKNEVLISVEDTGSGIPEQYYTKIFRRFEQIPNDSQKTQGSGLGLVICKAIVEKHGGSIWLESEVNRGSVFYFTIPVNQTEGE
ncbi:sensor histidine kinase [Clostridium fungisolvens]|uniref:histidine kinase n=1 Tax=Clostridium fungisolvens TaxID=1604897 RepID=A0A6V8SKL7_9CLOT|nr:HAMP domain-containing sensor histidine kinase [Clostridium fungisolvens]GFP77707.1 Non-motile and phage-resistance protein [Clostridium fungisolvens]